MRICIVGCGAVGSLFAANLASLDDVEVWAYDLAQEHVDAINERVTSLADRLRELLGERRGVRVHDQGRRRCGIVTFTVDGVSSTEVQQRLAQHGVNVSVSLVEYARLDLPGRGLPDLLRASVHYYNTEDELHRLIDALPPPK